jgi:mannan endo-1,4-beta-mannosidase
MQEEKAGWLYFCTWYDGGSDNNNFLSNPTFNTREDTIAMYQSDYCITLDELPKDLYKKDGVTPPDPSKTTTTTTVTTTTDKNVTTTTTAYKFAVQKKKVTIPDKPDLAVGMGMQIDLTGAPNASIGGAVGFGTTADDWKNIEWKGNADKDGKLTVNVDLNEMMGAFKTCEVQVWWSNVWNAATEKAVDQPYTIDKCEVRYYMGGALEPPKYGDANCDDIIDMSDAVLIMQALANPNKYGLKGTDERHITEEGERLADVDKTSEGLTSNDALRIQEYLLHKIPGLNPYA